MSDGTIILLFFAGLIILPICVVGLILMILKLKREKKKTSYTGVTQGTVEKITRHGMDAPWVIHVVYRVDGSTYRIKESAKLKSETIRAGKLPIGQKKTFVLGPVQEGSSVTVRYDTSAPQKAIIEGNDGLMTG